MDECGIIERKIRGIPENIYSMQELNMNHHHMGIWYTQKYTAIEMKKYILMQYQMDWRYSMGKTSVAQILVTRDRISMEDAMIRVNECVRRLQVEAIPTGDYEAATDIIADELGLEPDYMMDLLQEGVVA